MTVISSQFPPADPKPPKLPETPFDATIVSVQHTPITAGGHLLIKFAIECNASPTEEKPEEQPQVIFHSFKALYDIDPRAHLREGDHIRVTAVEAAFNLVSVTTFEFDTAQFASRYHKKREQG
jgi:hypothetical protein